MFNLFQIAAESNLRSNKKLNTLYLFMNEQKNGLKMKNKYNPYTVSTVRKY
jgi:hypothetical protein